MTAVRTRADLSVAGLESLVVTLLLAGVLLWLVLRWRRSGTVMRCVQVSLLAHLVLLLYACRVQWGLKPPGEGGGLLQIRLRDDPAWPVDSERAVERSEAVPSDGAAADAVAEGSTPSARSAASPTDEAAPDRPADAEQLAASAVPPALPRPEPPATSTTPAPSREPDVPAEQPLPPSAAATAAEAAPPADEVPSDSGKEPSKAPPELALAAEPPRSDPAEPPSPAPEPIPRPRDWSGDPAVAWLPRPAGQPASEPLPLAAPTRATPELLPDRQPVGALPQPVPATVPAILQARLAPDRLALARGWGATPHSEAAVAAALEWLARAQSGDGRWSAAAYGAGQETRTLGHDRGGAGARADTGISALALLAFLGTGQTHLAGPYRHTVQRGLAFLLASQSAEGHLAGAAELFAAMYCHGMGTLALAEAYALTGDPQLAPALRRALDYTLAAQHVGGGWRYQPHDPGDMSQFGWQVMALKAGQLGGLPIPQPTQWRMRQFLHRCAAGPHGGLASYRPGDRPSRTMTAEALVCRWLLDEELPAEAVAEATRFLLEELPGQGPANFYYWYYGTLALFPQQGAAWQRWNTALQRELLSRQRVDAAAAGSWDPNDLWGGYGGRVYSTALAALCLEVYYRYLPQQEAAPPSRLTDRLLVPAVPR